MSIKKHIPNILTLGNLFCGCLGILHVLDGYVYTAFWLMLIAAILDFFDGFVARLLKVSGPLGAELDSLADAVTFGVLPGMFMYKMIGNETEDYYLPFIGFLITLFSAYRLAMFNIDTEQSEHFKGVPTPINAIFIASLSLIESSQWQPNLIILVVTSILSSVLMVSSFPLLAIKFKSFGWSDNQAKYLLLIGSIILLFVFKIAAIPLILPLYLLISLIHFKLKLI